MRRNIDEVWYVYNYVLVTSLLAYIVGWIIIRTYMDTHIRATREVRSVVA